MRDGIKKLKLKKLQLKKIKISKIDHIHTIMGGHTTLQTYDEACIANLKSKFEKNDDTLLVLVCPTNTGTDRRTGAENATDLAETEQCV